VDPITELDARFSSEGATPTAWADAAAALETAPLYWLSTVRPDGRPHVTPLIGVWRDDRLHFTTGPSEQKAKNLEQNAHVILTTGSNALDEGLDVVVEGDAVPLTDESRLRPLADAYEAKYGADWHFDVRDGAFWGQGDDRAVVFVVSPTKVLGFAKGDYAQTRWRF
jgi:general stress protein 26